MNDKIVLFKKFLEEGHNQTKAALLSGINPKSTYDYVKKYNLIVLNKGTRYNHNIKYFDNIDTEEKAYLLGFFIADGYIENNRRVCFNNSIDDLEAIELARKEISPESKIIYSNKQKGVKFRKEQSTFRIASEQLANVLINKYKIINAKTFDSTFKFDFNLIPEELVRHFIRGFFDGDGSVSFYKTKSTLFFNFSFVFTSELFCNQFADIFENKFLLKRVIYKHEGKTANWLSLRFNCFGRRVKVIKEIYDYLYKDSTCFLTRKKLKFEQYFEYRANSLRKIKE